MRLQDKVALISGGARGMGAVEAHLFAREGAKVVIGDVLEDEGRRTEAAVTEAGGECVFVRLDVTSEADWTAAVATAVSRFGKLDVLVNNAGISITGGIEDLTVEDWERTFDINAKGVFLGSRAAIPEMRNAGGGSIINISSGAGYRARARHLRGLRRQQGRGPHLHQVHGGAVRQGEHPLQLGASRARRNADAALRPRLHVPA